MERLVGAQVMYCGHDGWFYADIIRVGNAVAVRASRPVTPGNLVRGRNDEATHHLFDFSEGWTLGPKPGCLRGAEKATEEGE